MNHTPTGSEPRPPENGLTPPVPEKESFLAALQNGALAGIVTKVVGEVLLLMDGRFEQAYRAGRASDGWQFKKLHLIIMMEYPWLAPALFGLLVGLATYYSGPQVKISEEQR